MGKRGPKQGSPSNNPAGKPKGAKDRLSRSIKERIYKYLEGDFESFITDIQSLEPRDRVRAVTELIKLVVPRPVSTEELDAIRGSQSALVSRLFMKSEEG